VAGGRRLALLTSAFLAGFFLVFATGVALAQSAAKQPATSSALDVRELGPTARAQIEALIADKESRNAAQRKIDSRVLLAVDAARPVPRRAILKSLAQPQAGADGRIVVDIDLVDGRRVNEVVAAVRQADGQVIFASGQFKSVRARIRPQAVESIAALSSVRFVDAERVVTHNKNTTSQGDVTHRANLVRSNMGYTGNGIKVCVLSDGIDTLGDRQATGDLPALVEVLPGQSGAGDEGTAMLEIVYDLVPEARLGFATVTGGEAQFAQNILDLADRSKGACKVIVDDSEYLSESPFQDGPIAQAVASAVASGVVVVSAASNSGNLDAGTSGTWEGDFRAPSSLTSPLIPGHVLHEFATGVVGDAALSPSRYVRLHWAEPAGAASADYDLYVLDASLSTVLASSTNTQNGSQNPFEFIASADPNGFPAGSRVVVAKKIGAPDRMLAVQWFRGRLTYATRGSTRGHSAVPLAISVAATPAAAADGPTPPNPTGPYHNAFAATGTVETFSADGPRRMFFDAGGNLLPGAPVGNFTSTGGILRAKPDVAAADGVATDTPGFTQFWGTSAAAPHVAAAAAMMLQAFPAWTPQQVKNALVTSAIDVQQAGWDPTSGAGIVMPLAALQASGAPAAAAVKLVDVSATEVRGNGNGLPDPNEDWQFAITLGNGGGATATGVSATLVSNTPGVTVTSGSIAFGSIPVGGQAAAGAAFRFSVGAIACGQSLDFVLQVSTAQNPMPLSLPISMASNPGLSAPQTFSYVGPSVAIPDGGTQAPGATAIASLPVSGVNGPVGKVVLRIDGLNGCAANAPENAGIDHSYVGDLVVTLQSPDGRAVKVINRMNSGFNYGQNFCEVTLDDAATGASIGSATGEQAPFTGAWRPDEALATMKGGNANGVWQLQANDWMQSKTGHINRFSLIVQTQSCGAGSAPPPSGGTATQSFDVDGDGRYDALTDGLLVLRYLLGLTGASLTDHLVAPGAQRTTPQQVTAWLDGMRASLDVDGNGVADALTDGIIVMRYMFGIRGAALVDNALGQGATRTGAQIEQYLGQMMP